MHYSGENIIVFSCCGLTEIEQYLLLEKREGVRHERRLINGKVTGCGNCVGYCRFEEHAGFLTREQRREHDCLGKQCRYYLGKPKKRERMTLEQCWAVTS